jgi:hypothetical protein
MEALFGKLADAINDLGRDVGRSAAGHEAAFLGLLEAVAVLREVRQAALATAREAGAADVPAGVPDRRLMERGRSLEQDVRGVRQQVERAGRAMGTRG